MPEHQRAATLSATLAVVPPADREAVLAALPPKEQSMALQASIQKWKYSHCNNALQENL